MKKRICAILLTLFLFLSACAPGDTPEPDPAPEPAPTPVPAAFEPENAAPEVKTVLGIELTEDLSEREKGWIKDLDWLREEWERRHANPYYMCSKEEFEWKLEQLAARVGELSDEDMLFEIHSIVIGMDDDLHSWMVWPEYIYDRLFPIFIRYIGDKPYLENCLKGYEQLEPYLLHEIVAVNGVDMAYIQRKFESFYCPSNVWHSKEFFFEFSSLTAFYDWAGCGYKEGYTFQILNDNLEVVDVEVPVVTREEREALGDQIEWAYPENWERLAYMKGGNWAEYFEGENGGYIYLSFENIGLVSDDICRKLAEAAGEVVTAHPECHKLVIDLRWNPGGNGANLAAFKEGMGALKSPSIEQTYVVVGGVTASAGVIFCIPFFKGELDAVVIGEPTGQFISGYHNTVMDKFMWSLPYSKIEINAADDWAGWEESLGALREFSEAEPIAEEYFDEDGNLYGWECTILPDVYVSQKIEDIRQGRDSVIEWVLRQ